MLAMRVIRRVLCCLVLLLSPAPLLAQSAPGAFTSGTRYDLAGRVTGTIEGAPFGTGGPFAATRSSYDGLGNLASVEEGQLAGWQDETVAPANWASFSVLRTRTYGYDGYGRKVIEQLHAGGAGGQVASVTQYSYDLYGRVVCTAVRMDPAQWGGQGDPCAAQTTGPNGPDRITRTSYDYLGNVLVVQRAVGTSIQQNYETCTWNTTTGGAGKPATVADANGNLTSYTYGKTALNLLGQANFPSPTAAGQSSGSDYESYDYDANGNRTSLRKRDGRTIGYAYDALNLVVSKTYPNGGARTVYYAYDLLGHQTAARFDGPGGGDAVLTGWDGFGELVTSTTAMAGTARTLGHGYNADGGRVGMSWPDGHVVDYNRYDTGQLYYTDQSGIGPLFHTPMDGYGRVQATYRWGYGPSTWSFGSFYGYDGVSRPSSIAHALAGGVGNVTNTFGYNPASQIVSDARDNDAYAFTGYVTVDRPYGVNGLNQYTSAGSATFGYDANGNLTSDGTNSWSYDVENRLVSSSSGAQLTYDPLGRLWQTAGTGTGTTQFLYDGDALVAEYDGSGNMLRRYVHGDGADVPEVQYAGAQVMSPTYLFADHQGSIVAQTDPSGNETQINRYDEYGIPGAGNAGRFQYTGQAWLPELGMYYYKARIYSPTLGRFMQTDPIGYKDQINLYAYVGSDPVNRTDSSGQECHPVGQRRTQCDPPISNATPFQLPVISGGVGSLQPSDADYHKYGTVLTISADGTDNQYDRVASAVINNPTPGNDRPATAGGTNNNAPVTFLSSPDTVKSYVARTADGRTTIVVNNTTSDHIGSPGYVAHYITRLNDGSVRVTTVGEGKSPYQYYGDPSNNRALAAWHAWQREIIGSSK